VSSLPPAGLVAFVAGQAWQRPSDTPAPRSAGLAGHPKRLLAHDATLCSLWLSADNAFAATEPEKHAALSASRAKSSLGVTGAGGAAQAGSPAGRGEPSGTAAQEQPQRRRRRQPLTLRPARRARRRAARRRQLNLFPTLNPPAHTKTLAFADAR